MGRAQTELQALGARLAMEAEASLGEGRIVHIHQRDLVRDTVGALEAAYARLGLKFSDAYRQHLTRRVAEREKPSHAYDMADYGLTVPGLRAAFRFYTEMYNIPLEANLA